jgi:hypothetical protein
MRKKNETISQIRTYNMTREKKSTFFGRIEISAAVLYRKPPSPPFAPVTTYGYNRNSFLG